MSKICEICGKGPMYGATIARRGLAKKKGGVGKKVTGVTKRRFLANLQTVKANIQGTIKRVKLCAKCLKANKVTKV